ncbi:GntR family transcriptional regulator/MocR family aminotransferase [Caulobacter ginsengisoli]|uniref:GntR family transcriptional regulator/MocR family aminotransferase n=1 Tax=Caulobacter ginsengisoli TaxID=400775 RepID=A0ABU0IQR8_9CAUL|nr:PLP-dependent aminotransferase family protein [Caulobacter ginsengisoli]MDQ0464367.1 GntR family transcriptional regulator/MocR family aminotransferase [Caulobacter ginsengisoli]
MSWADIYPWERPGSGPGQGVVRGVYAQVRAAILGGALPPASRLPSTRDLAARLGVARASVVEAYEQLAAEGYLLSRRGAGAFVSADLSGLADLAPSPVPPALDRPEIPPPARAFAATAGFTTLPGERPFNTGRTLLDPRAAAAWGRSTRRALRHLGPEHFGYSDPQGDVALRAAIADYLRAARGVVCEPGQVIVTTGAQHAVDIAARVLLTPGLPVWIEDPHYPSTLHAVTQAKAQIHSIPVDRLGLSVAAGVAAAPDARVAFVTPSHQYPLGVTLSMARRLDLLAWARSAGAWIVEDDYASEFRYGGPPLASLQGLDGGERVIYVGTLNKALFPGLRLGYLVAPKALAGAMATARQIMDRQPSTLTQAILLDFMAGGQFAAHIRRRRLAYRAQRDALAAALETRLGDLVEVDVPDQGMHLIAYLKDGADDLAAEAKVLAAGITARAISRLYRTAPPRSGLMLGFSGFPVSAMKPGVAALERALRAP